jgi:uncharacterized protein YdcH (DUF465 family)
VFDEILNDVWCTYSLKNGYKRWREVKSKIEQPLRNIIETEIQHILLGHGIEQARLAAKDEMYKYLKHLRGKYNVE